MIWKDRCKSNFIQSPINMDAVKIISKLQKDLAISYNFYDVYPIISRRFNEAIVKFSHHPGVLMMTLGSNKVIFVPKYISFRFSSEHSFNGKRYDGEIQIHLEELMPDKKRHLVNGMIISIPLETKSNFLNFSPLESLGMDFWKKELEKKKKYKPQNFLNKQKNVFSLNEIFNKILVSKSKYFLYLGSQTVPPCTGKMLYICRFHLSSCCRKTVRNIEMSINNTKRQFSARERL